MKAWCVSSLVAAVCLVGSAGAAEAQKQMPRFVPDVVGQFDALTERPDAMGFEIARARPVAVPPHAGGHAHRRAGRHAVPARQPQRQGHRRRMLQRQRTRQHLHRPHGLARQERRAAAQQSAEAVQETTDTPPDPADGVVDVILFDGTSEWPHFDHPGAMQQVGNVVALALEAGQSGQPTTKILFFDVTDPEHPAMLNNSFPRRREKAGVVGITPCGAGREGVPCATGHFLMLVSGGDNDELSVLRVQRR